jgi:hypothetical protein
MKPSVLQGRKNAVFPLKLPWQRVLIRKAICLKLVVNSATCLGDPLTEEDKQTETFTLENTSWE